MSAALLTADWVLLGRDLHFRKFEIYSMGWQNEVNVENCILATAQYGGPIAVRRNDKKVVKVQGSAQPIVSIYSSSGQQISHIRWKRKAIVLMGWSNTEKLVCVLDDGTVILHDIFGKFLHEFSISKRVQESKVADAQIFTSPQNSTGVAVLTTSFSVFLVNNIEDPKTRRMSELPRSSVEPSSWIVIPEEPQTEVLVARGTELYRLTQDEHLTSTAFEPEMTYQYTKILHMAISFNARHLAMFTDTGCLWLGSSNLRTKYCEVETQFTYNPSQLCGTEAVVAYWELENTLLVVGRHGKTFSYTYDGAIHLASEIDGIRILSTTQHELLQKVPDVVQKIFRINSTEPGSFLLEASKQFQKRSHRANEYITLVKDDLAKAVEQCIEAVGYEFDTDIQKMLIRAAQFGKCFVPNLSSDDYVKMCRLLRVLNAVRDPKIGIPLTFMQYPFHRVKYLTPSVLLDRLVTRRHYYLAIQIAKYLKMPDAEGSSRILVQWAKYKVSQTHLDEEVIAREIANKLGYAPGISYSEIANTAAEFGRKKLAIKLLDYELRASEQVKLLLQLSENTRESTPALVKAIESGDTDLIYTVILKLRDKMPLADFKMTIRNFPVAQALYIKYCKEHNPQALNEIYIQEDDFNSQALLFVMESLDPKKSDMKYAALTSAMEAYKKSRNDLYAGACEEALRLSRDQRDFEDKLGYSFSGKTIHETCKKLLEIGELKRAEKFKNDYKIPDKRYWWLRIQTLAFLDEWTELEKFSKVKKSPIGYAPFVDVCLQKDKKNEAAKYLSKVNDDIKVKYYIKAEKLEEATDIAFEQRDVQSLLNIQTRCAAQSQLSERINNLIVQLVTINLATWSTDTVLTRTIIRPPHQTCIPIPTSRNHPVNFPDVHPDIPAQTAVILVVHRLTTLPDFLRVDGTLRVIPSILISRYTRRPLMFHRLVIRIHHLIVGFR
ncbi:vacuolar protein sorting-associated protein [Rhyzopertha dominica]|nr:vacuolar protein sorting-associated protein [Rhyzopertha dominica]